MIEFKLLHTVIRLDFSFFAVMSLFLFFNGGAGVNAFLSCIFHELGHLIAMALLSVRLDELFFYGGGIRISADIGRLSGGGKITVLAAGCAFNLLLAVVFLLLGVETAAAVNVMTALVNLMPLSHLDGAQIAQSVLSSCLEPNRVELLMRILQIFADISAILVILLFRAVPDITLIAFSIYLFLLRKGKYISQI